jgi:hypothetical protein
MRPSSSYRTEKDSPPATEERRSAERRMCQPYPRSSDKRRRLPMLQRGCAPLSGARPPSGASPRHSPPATTPMAQPQNRVSAKYGAQVFCPFAAHALCVKHAPCGPVLLPVDRCPRAARERIAFHPRAGTASRCRLPKVPSRKAPLVRRDFAQVTKMRTTVKPTSHKKSDACRTSRREAVAKRARASRGGRLPVRRCPSPRPRNSSKYPDERIRATEMTPRRPRQRPRPPPCPPPFQGEG